MQKQFDTNFGCDPEVFIVGESGVIPPAAFIADYQLSFHDSKAPKKIIIEGDDYRIIEDGAATELNVKPDMNFNILWSRIDSAIRSLKYWVTCTSMVKTDHAEVVISPSVIFDKKKYWTDRDESFRDCVRFGCDPDLDIYTGQFSKEINVEDVKLRFGGGHLHMQAPSNCPDLFQENYYHTTKLMDILVGNTATAIVRNPSSMDKAEKERLKYYGQPGKIRLQTYGKGVFGIEYRTPSNFWLCNARHANMLFVLMNCCLNLTQHPQDASRILTLSKVDSAPHYIVNYDKHHAKDLVFNCINKLVEMKYLDFDTFRDFINLTDKTNE